MVKIDANNEIEKGNKPPFQTKLMIVLKVQ